MRRGGGVAARLTPRRWRDARDLTSIPLPMTRADRSSPSRRAKASAHADVAVAPTQFDLFPVRPVVDVLDPRAVVGPNTGVENLVRVRLRPNDAPHLVFHDRHGWYCETHGPTCHAVILAREASP